MVRASLIALVTVALTGPARADDEGAFNMLAVDGAMGTIPTTDTMTRATSLGVSVEHPVFTKIRIVAGYEWLWLGPETGHRASLALRRELWGHGTSHSRAFVDAELGASLALLSRAEAMPGVDLMPAGFAGVRLGYDLYSDRDESPSRTFETAFACRVLAVEHGVGFTLGLSTAWGN